MQHKLGCDINSNVQPPNGEREPSVMEKKLELLNLDGLTSPPLSKDFAMVLHDSVHYMMHLSVEIDFSAAVRAIGDAIVFRMPVKGITNTNNELITSSDAMLFRRTLLNEAASIDNMAMANDPCGFTLPKGRLPTGDETAKLNNYMEIVLDKIRTGHRTPPKAPMPATPASQLSQAETLVSTPAQEHDVNKKDGTAKRLDLSPDENGGGFGQAATGEGASEPIPLTPPPKPPAPSLHDQVPMRQASPTFTVTLDGHPRQSLLLAAQEEDCEEQRLVERQMTFNAPKPQLSPEKPELDGGLSTEQIQDNKDFGKPMTWVVATARLTPVMIAATKNIEDIMAVVNNKKASSDPWQAENFIMCHPKVWDPNGCDCLFPRCIKCHRIMPGSPFKPEHPKALQIYFSCCFRPWTDRNGKQHDTNFYGKPRDCKKSGAGSWIEGSDFVKSKIRSLENKHGMDTEPVYAFLRTRWVRKIVLGVLMHRTYMEYKTAQANAEAQAYKGSQSKMSRSLAQQGIDLAAVAAAMAAKGPSMTVTTSTTPAPAAPTSEASTSSAPPAKKPRH